MNVELNEYMEGDIEENFDYDEQEPQAQQENPYQQEVAEPNAGDCLAESYASVWD